MIKKNSKIERIIIKSKIGGEPIVQILVDGDLLVVTYIDSRFGITREFTSSKSVERESIDVGAAL